MSKPLTSTDVLFQQRLLACAGLYAGKLDGLWGPETEAASTASDALFAKIRTELGEFDGRSERCLRTLLPNVQRLARQFLTAKLAAGLSLRIISGTRTYAEQDALYRQGRNGNPGPVVTRSRAGQSNHNFGLAWDIGIFDNGRYLTDSPLYTQAADTLLPGLEWGGKWVSFPDQPHYQAVTGLTIKEVRSQFEAGTLRVGEDSQG